MMDRTKYLEMARQCAMLRDKTKVPDRLRVIYKGIEYYPQSYELAFFEDGTVNHIAIIHDLNANSICSVALKNITLKES